MISGKIGSSDDISGKNSSLDDHEWKPIHAHPFMGVAKSVENDKECCLVCSTITNILMVQAILIDLKVLV
jgi:hypothetical protein